MNISSVKSSYLKEIGYDPETRELQVQFANGGRFSYFDVPQGAYDSLMASESIGKHFAANIKGQYGVKKHEPKPKPEGE